MGFLFRHHLLLFQFVRSEVPDIVSMAKVLCTHEERDMCMAFAGRVSVSHGYQSRSTSWVCLFWQSQGNNAAQLIRACNLRESWPRGPMYPLSECWDLWENFIGRVYFHVLIAWFLLFCWWWLQIRLLSGQFAGEVLFRYWQNSYLLGTVFEAACESNRDDCCRTFLQLWAFDWFSDET